MTAKKRLLHPGSSAPRVNVKWVAHKTPESMLAVVESWRAGCPPRERHLIDDEKKSVARILKRDGFHAFSTVGYESDRRISKRPPPTIHYFFGPRVSARLRLIVLMHEFGHCVGRVADNPFTGRGPDLEEERADSYATAAVQVLEHIKRSKS